MKVKLGASSPEKRALYNKRLDILAEIMGITRNEMIYEILCNVMWINDDHLFSIVHDSLEQQAIAFAAGNPEDYIEIIKKDIKSNAATKSFVDQTVKFSKVIYNNKDDLDDDSESDDWV